MEHGFIVVYERGLDGIYAVSQDFGYVCPIPSPNTKRFSRLEGAKAQALLLANVDPINLGISVRDTQTGEIVFDASEQVIREFIQKFLDDLLLLAPQLTEPENNLLGLAYSLLKQRDFEAVDAVLKSLIALLDARKADLTLIARMWGVPGV